MPFFTDLCRIFWESYIVAIAVLSVKEGKW